MKEKRYPAGFEPALFYLAGKVFVIIGVIFLLLGIINKFLYYLNIPSEILIIAIILELVGLYLLYVVPRK